MKTKKILAVLILMCVILSLFTACGRHSKVEVVNDKDLRIIYVLVNTDENNKPATVVIRKMEENKENEKFEAAKEYTPKASNEKNQFVQTVYEEGMYEIEVSCEGFKTVKYAVEVNKNKIYSIETTMDKA